MYDYTAVARTEILIIFHKLPAGSEGQGPLVILQSVRKSPTQLLHINILQDGGPFLHQRKIGFSVVILGIFLIDVGREIFTNLKQLLFQSGQNVQLVSRYQKFEMKGIFKPVWSVKGRKICREKKM